MSPRTEGIRDSAERAPPLLMGQGRRQRSEHVDNAAVAIHEYIFVNESNGHTS
jgi:hypothetical protein